MAEVTSEGVSALVRSQLEEILGSVEGRQRFGLTSRFTPEHEDRIDWMEKAIRGFQNDYTLGRVMSGPTWISGTSIMDGTITADKLLVNTLESITVNTGNLNVTGNFIAAASFPAVGARIETNSLGIWGYSSGVTTTFKFNTDGSGSIGTAPNNISWNTSGVLSVPVAVIGSLTIADVGSGVIGGTYQSSAATTRFEMSPTSFRALALGTETFKLDAATGAVTMTGSFTVLSAATGAHVKIDNSGGIAGYNATSEITANRTFLLNAATGAGHLGSSTTGISWDFAGAVSIGGVALSGGKITASMLSVSQLSSIAIDAGTITAGNITANTITTGTLLANRISGGTVGGSFSLGVANLAVNSTGRITFGASGLDYLADDALHFSLSGSPTGKVSFSRSGFTPTADMQGFIDSDTGQVSLRALYSSTRFGELATVGDAALGQVSQLAQYDASNSAGMVLRGVAAGGSYAEVRVNNNISLQFDATSRRALFGGAVHPGTGSGTQTTGYLIWSGTRGQWINSDFQFWGKIFPGNGVVQASTYIDADANDLGIQLGGSADTNEFIVRNSSGTARFAVSGTGRIAISSGTYDMAATAVATVTGVWALFGDGGALLGYVPIYASYS